MLIGLLALASACASRPSPFAQDIRTHRAADVEVLRQFSHVPRRVPMIATDDGSLYFAIPDTVFRSSSGDPRTITPIIMTDTLCVFRSHCRAHFEELHVEADTLYLVNGTSEVYRWVQAVGISELATPLADSTYFCHDFITDAGVRDVGTFNDELIAVASHGYVISRKDEWRLEYIGRRPRVSLCLQDSDDMLSAVGGTGRNVFAGGFEIVQLRPRIQWLDRPKESRGLIIAIAAQGNLVFYAVSAPAHVLVHDGERFYVQLLYEDGIRMLENGRTQPDGSILFWGRNGIVHVQDGRFQVIEIAGYQSIAGAALIGTELYAIGVLEGGRAHLVRVEMPPSSM